jgi:predicted transcriptional regulator
LQKLAKDCEGIIAFAHDGPVILIQRDRLTDNETILLRLLAAHLGKALGKSASETISKDELQVKLGKNPKIVSTRLSELVKNEFVSKGKNEDYRLTDLGVTQMQKEVLPKV